MKLDIEEFALRSGWSKEELTNQTKLRLKSFSECIANEFLQNTKPTVEYDFNLSGTGVIKTGTTIGQDHRFFVWPQCAPPLDEYKNEKYKNLAKDVNMKFHVIWNKNIWTCIADGYGSNRSYGNGAIHIMDFNGVILTELE